MIDLARRGACALALLLLAGCGGSEPVAETETVETPQDATTGDEVVAEEPVEMRYTTPIPVPQPAVDRGSMTAALQTLWDRVELAVAVRPPEPPAQATAEAIEAWASGPFAAFIARRREAVAQAEAAIAGVRSMSAI